MAQAKKRKVQVDETAQAEPPVRPLYLLTLALPRDRREKIIGDFTEEYRELIPRFGMRRANFFLWVRVIQELWPLIIKGWEKAKKLWKWLIVVGVGKLLMGTGLGPFLMDLIHSFPRLK